MKTKKKAKQSTTLFIKAIEDYQVDTFNILFGNKTLNKKRSELHICSCL